MARPPPTPEQAINHFSELLARDPRSAQRFLSDLPVPLLTAVAYDSFSQADSRDFLELFARHLDALVLCDDPSPLRLLSPAALAFIVESGLKESAVAGQKDVHSRLADLIIERADEKSDGADGVWFLSILTFLDFERIRFGQLREIVRVAAETPPSRPIPRRVYQTVIDFLTQIPATVTALGARLAEDIRAVVRANPSVGGGSGGLSSEQIAEVMEKLSRESREEEQELKDSVEIAEKKASEALAIAKEAQAEKEQIREELKQLKAAMAAAAPPRAVSALEALPLYRRNCNDVLKVCEGHWSAEASPMFARDRLLAVLCGSSGTFWVSDPHFKGKPSIMIRFHDEVSVCLGGYRLGSGIRGQKRSPFMRTWELFGCVNGSWIILDSHETDDTLSDGEEHDFAIGAGGRVLVDALRLCQTGRNGLGTCQMHLTKFVLSGSVVASGDVVEVPSRSHEAHVVRAVPSIDSPKRVPVLETDNSVSLDGGSTRSSNPLPEKTSDADVVTALLSDNAVAVNSVETAPASAPASVRSDSAAPVAQDRLEPAADPKVEVHDPPPPAAIVAKQADSSGPISTPRVADGPSVRSPSPQTASKPGNSGDSTPAPPPTDAGIFVVDEAKLFNVPTVAQPGGPKLITSLAGLEEMREIGSSRFGAVRLMRRPNGEGSFDHFAAKFYNAGDNREGRQAFDDRIRAFLDLSHPHVMPIVGVIPPTKVTGPILITPYSEFGSLEDVLDRVRRNDPPKFWNDEAKLRMIVSLVSGLHYLHRHGIVHRELKPTDLIVFEDGSIRICGYSTSVLEEHRFIRASQVGGPSYMAPEIYDDEHDGAKLRDPKTDVFSFGLILFEIICGHKVFPQTMSAAVIMRRAMSTRQSDRSVIPSTVNPVIRELISLSWVPNLQKRPTFEFLWKRMAGVKFNLFPAVSVRYQPANS